MASWDADTGTVGSTLSSADPVAYVSQGPVARLRSVPNGKSRVVVAEAREGMSEGLPVIAYGISVPFDLEPGESVELGEPLELARPLPDQFQAQVELLFNGKHRERVNALEIAAATLYSRGVGAAELVIANDASFSAALTELSLFDQRIDCLQEPSPGPSLGDIRGEDVLEPADADEAADSDSDDRTLSPIWRTCYLDGWDLTAGLPESGDGFYSVYVRFRDAQGYESQTYKDTVILDTVPPSLLGTPTIERVDGRTRAQIAPNRVRVRPGTLVRVSFAVSEPTSLPPQVSAGSNSYPPSVWADGDTLFVVELPAPTKNGETAVLAKVTDLAGNTAELTLGTLEEDSEPTDLSDAAIDEYMRLFRAPWGCQETGFEARTELRLCPYGPGTSLWSWCDPTQSPLVIDDGTVVSVHAAEKDAAGSPVCRDDLLAQKTVGVGNEPISMQIAGDWPMACITLTDRAGNTSIPRAVTLVQWVVTMGFKEAGLTAGNPHRFEARQTLAPYLHQLGEEGVEEIGQWFGIAETDRGAFQTAGGGFWQRMLDDAPSYRVFPGMAYDAGRGRLVMVGGGTFGANCQEGSGQNCTSVWEWARDGWRLVTKEFPGENEIISDMTVGYDPVGDRIVGLAQASGTGWDNWFWDGSVWTSGNSLPSDAESLWGLLPAPDRGRMLAVLWSEADAHPEVWRLDDAGLWQQSETLDSEMDGAPGKRESPAVASDPSSGAIVLHGGRRNPGPQPLADTWEWNAGRWRLVSSGGPISAEGARAVSSATGEGVILYVPDLPHRGLWAWNGKVWELESSVSQYCSPSAQAADGIHGGIAVWCDSHIESWDGVRWRSFWQQNPGPREAAATTYDTELGSMLLFGGRSPDEQKLLGGLWAFNGLGWELLWEDSYADEFGLVGPAPRWGAAMAHNPIASETILFGGCSQVVKTPLVKFGCATPPLGDTWRWRDWEWAEADEGDHVPSPRSWSAMAYNVARARSVLVGGYGEGYSLGDTWELSNSGWTLALAAGAQGAPPLLMGHAAAYDGKKDHVLVLGGGTVEANWIEAWSTDIFEWVGKGWEGAASGLAPRFGPGLAYDSKSESLLTFGGCLDFGATAVMCKLFDGQLLARRMGIWSELSSSGGPSPRMNLGMAYDESLDRLVIFGGRSDDGTLGDTWQWVFARDQGPGHVLTAQLDSAGYSNPAASLKEATVTWLAGGTGNTEGGPSPGLRLLVWQNSRWTEIATSNADVEDPAWLTWTDSNAGRLARLPTGPRHEVTVAATPKAPNGNGKAVVATDYAEASFLFRLNLAAEAGTGCSDAEDNDGDGRVDCADPDCAEWVSCETSTELTCDDARDNDGDLAADCADLDCWCSKACAWDSDGCCVGPILARCDEGTLKQVDCRNSGGSGPFCGWDSVAGNHACGAAGPTPLGKECPGGCTPDCGDRECGFDGCNGSCGQCKAKEVCNGGHCQCLKDCGDSGQCGPDGCGGNCGSCAPGHVCIDHSCRPYPLPCTGLADYQVCCVGNVSYWCHNDALTAYVDCGATGSQCGWTGTGYGCADSAAEDPSGAMPRECPDPDSCVPQCEGLDCGPDDCGGQCGQCGVGEVCDAMGQCCEPLCQPPKCGSDGCGGSCGCPAGQACGTGFLELCEPLCPDGTSFAGCCEGQTLKWCEEGQSKELDCLSNPACGWDSVNAYYDCGTDGKDSVLGGSKACTDVCQPNCAGKECGPDGCDASCGECAPGNSCVDGECIQNACAGIPDFGCCKGDSLLYCSDGTIVSSHCPPGETCGWDWTNQSHYCSSSASAGLDFGDFPLACQAACESAVCSEQECGPDGCGGDCGECNDGQVCTLYGLCCLPACDGKECGFDGCGGWCGECPAGQACKKGQCASCEPDCAGAECGSDGCGGSCGHCPTDCICAEGQCSPTCQAIPQASCCEGNVHWTCFEGTVLASDCSESGLFGEFCGWLDWLGKYECASEAIADPTGENPMECPW